MLFFFLIVQCLLEGFIYSIFLAIINKKELKDIIEILDSIVRFFCYRFGITIIPYILFSLFICLIVKKKSLLFIGILNLIINVTIIGFIGFYLEPLLFDKKIFITTLIVGVLILIFVMIIKPKFILNILQKNML